MDRDERELVRRCLRNDQDACSRLVEGHARIVGTVVWRATGDHQIVDDLVQEVFLRVFRGLAYFDGRARLSTWIYTIAHRVAVDHLRQAGRWREERTGDAAGDVLDRLSATAADPETAAAQDEMDLLVREQLAELPDKYRLPFVYAAVEGLDHATIGGILGVQTSSVKTLVFRGRQMLKQRIGTALRARCRSRGRDAPGRAD